MPTTYNDIVATSRLRAQSPRKQKAYTGDALYTAHYLASLSDKSEVQAEQEIQTCSGGDSCVTCGECRQARKRNK